MATDKQVVVITGSSGRVGERIIQKLNQSIQPIGLDFIGTIPPTPALEFVFVDLGSDVAVKKAFDRIAFAYGNKITSVVHLAAYYSFEGKNLDLYDKITVKGTERLLNECKRFDVEQFIFTSTMLVHNPTPRGVIITEDDPIVGKWHYPASKVKTEHLIAEKHGNIPYVILRIAGCYDDECNCIPISQHISRIFEKQLAGYFFPGNSNNGVPYIHFDDLVEMVLLCIAKRHEIPKDLVLLAAEEDSISYRDLQTTFGRLIWGKDWPMIWIPKPAAKSGAWAQGLIPWGPKPFIKPWMVDLADDNYEVSVEKAKRILGWTPKHNLRETLPTIVENMKQDPLAWYRRHKMPITNAARRSAEKLRK
jgi:UDP-glucose 4-epimerase